jgi:hypothetical protein
MAAARRTASSGRPPGPPARATRRSPDDAQAQATPRYLQGRREALASYADVASLGESHAASSMARQHGDGDLAASLPSRPREEMTAEVGQSEMPQLDQSLDRSMDQSVDQSLDQSLDETVDGPADPAAGDGAAGDGAAAPAADGGEATAETGGGQGRPGPAARQRRRGGDEEEDGLEERSDEAPVDEPATSPVVLMRRPLDLRGVDAPLAMPRYLSVEPVGGKSAVPAPARGYENAFAAVASSAERLHRGFIQDGRDSAAALVSLYRRMEDESQRTLDSSLFDLARTLDSARLDLATAEADAIARLELQAQTARILIRGAARRALGTVSARKGVIEQRISLARAGAADVETELASYAAEVDRAGPPASQAFTSLDADPSPAHVPNAAADYADYGPEMQVAENEPLDDAVKHRSRDRSTAFAQATTIFAGQLATAATSFQSAATEAFQPFQNYINQLGTSAPNQIATMRKNALRQVRKTVRNGIEAVKRSRRQIERSLVERYDRSRRQIVATAERAGEAQHNGLARAGEGQLQGYRAMAAAQGGTVTALHDEIARQRGQTAEQFAAYVRQASERTDERAGAAGRGRREAMASGAERMRRQTEARGSTGTATQARTSAALAEQLAASARQSGLSLMAQVLGLEAGLRQMAEPIAKVIDSFPIPAEDKLREMQDTLWEKLNAARQQAHAAYHGGSAPASEEPLTSGGGGQAATPPPAGTGTKPKEFVDKATALASAPAGEEQIVSVTRTIANGVVGDVTQRGDGLMGQMTLLGQNPGETLNLVRGLTYKRGQAVIRYYNAARPGNLWDDIAFYMSFGNPVTGIGTRIESGDAVYNYLLGNRAAGALHEIQAATQWWNNGDQVQEAMTALSPTDVAALRGMEGAGAVLDAVENDLDGADRRMFQILRNVTSENAADSVAAVRAIRLDVQVEEALQADPERGADNAFDIMERAAEAGGRTRLEGAREFGLTADYQVETQEQAEARRDRSWQETVARLGNDGQRRADGAAGGVEYLRQLASRQRTYVQGEYAYQASARPEQVRLLTNLAAHGPGAPETRAAQLMVEETRRGGAKPERLEHALHDPDLNPDMANPDRPPPPDGRPEETPERLARAREREERMFQLYDQYRNPGREGPPRSTTEIRAELGARLRAGQTDERQGRLMERQATHGLTDPQTAALAFEHAVERAGTDEDLLRRQFGRMSRDQIDAAVARYDANHSPGLYERLGIFEHSGGYFRELSGDDRLEIQVAAMGQPRNDRERAEVARMTSRLQLDNAGIAGPLLAREEHRRLRRSHDRLIGLMGVRDAENDTSFDARGRLVLAGERGSRQPVGRFNAEGGFVPEPGRGAMEFAMMMATNQRNADAYKQATDNIANAITTTLVVAAAVVSTIATGGAAASIWIPVLATAGAGVVGMAASWAIKGGRYGYEDAGRDFGMTIVQAATAGIGAGLGIARAGGSTAFRAAMGARMISNQGFRAMSLFDEALIAGASGAIGGGGNALFDDKAWDRGEWLANIGHGMRKGFLGGFAGGVVTGGATRAIGGVAQGLGRASGALTAFSRGRGADVGSRLGRLRGDAYSKAFPTTLAGRTIGGGLGGAATRYVEIDYDRRRGTYLGSRAQAMEEIADAGIQNSFQSFLEGIGEHASDHSPRMKAWREAAMAGQAPPALPPRLPPAAEPGAPEAGTPPLPADRTDDPAPPSVRNSGGEEPEAPAARPGGGDEEEASARLVAANDDSDPVVARSLVDSGEAAPLAVIPPKPVRMALNPHNMLAMGRIPEASVFIHPNSKSFEAANDNYRMLTQADPSREAAIYRNADTGEYLVIQGREGHVTTIDRYGNLQIRGVKEGVPVARGPHAPEPGGRWVLEHHYHPTKPGDAPGAYLARFPSGTNGDIRVIVREAEAHGMDSRSSRIDFIDNGRTNYTTFAYDAVTKVVTIDYPDPITGARVVEKFANPKAYDDHIATLLGRSAELRAGTPALGRNAVRTSLTAGDAFSARRLGEAAMSSEAHRRAISLLEARGASPETIAAFRAEADSAEGANRNVARDLGLVGEPDSMARLHLIMNDTSLDAPMRQAIADTVLAATREHMIATGQLARDEPLLLLFHGAPVERAASLHESGAQLAKIDGDGSSDDFGRGLYLTSQVENAEIYAAKKNVARGEIFPFVLRGRDLGTVVDVSPGGVHRAEWEAFVMRNLGKFGSAMPVKGAVIDPRDYVAGKRPFGTMNAWGNRGVVFEAFLAHLAAKTGDPRIAVPDVVLGELGGPMTSGYGRGDQQAIRSQAVMDEMNRQIGFRPREPGSGAQVEGGAEPARARSTVDEDSDVIEARSLSASAPGVAATLPPANPTPQWIKPQDQDDVLALFARHKDAREAVGSIRALAKIDRDGVMAVLHAQDADAARAALIRLEERLVALGMPKEYAAIRRRRMDYAYAMFGSRFRIEAAHRAMITGGGYAKVPGLSTTMNRWLNESAVLRFVHLADPQTFADLHAGFVGGRFGAGSRNRVKNFEAYVLRQVKSNPTIKANAPWFHEMLAILPRDDAVLKMLTREDTVPPSWPDPIAQQPVPASAIGPPITDPAAVRPGLRVDHANGNRGTVVEVVGGVAHVHFDGEPDTTVHQVPIAGGELNRSLEPNALFGDPPEIRDPIFAKARLDEVRDHRVAAGLPPYGKTSGGTAAMVQINGKSFHGTNSRLDPGNYSLPKEARRRLFDHLKDKFGLKAAHLGDAQFISHAEGEALLRAFLEFGSLPEVVEIYVDRETCDFCEKDLSRIARMLGVKELRIYQLDTTKPNPLIMR